ncbi:MAG: hypothetical protein HYZ37_02705 [Candidatus Solibacter usitatus]|nr:hypothetical protein [Candidatus Solibacter usitatus]
MTNATVTNGAQTVGVQTFYDQAGVQNGPSGLRLYDTAYVNATWRGLPTQANAPSGLTYHRSVPDQTVFPWVWRTCKFTSNNDAIPHLTGVSNYINTSEGSPQTLYSPFSPFASFGAAQMLNAVTMTGVNPGSARCFFQT